MFLRLTPIITIELLGFKTAAAIIRSIVVQFCGSLYQLVQLTLVHKQLHQNNKSR